MFPLCLFFKTSRLEFWVLAEDEGLILSERAGISETEVVEPGFTVVPQRMPVGFDYTCGISKITQSVYYSCFISHSVVSGRRDNHLMTLRDKVGKGKTYKLHPEK